jgi:hypothetical protein
MTVENTNPEVTQQPTQAEPEFNFTLALGEANLILQALEELPHKVSRKLIDKLVQQAQAQVPQQ